jgi:D-serine dehydratase
VSPSPARPEEAPLNSCDKGIPGNVTAVHRRNVSAQGWNLLREDLPLPVAVLKQNALTHNSQWMRNFVRHHGVYLAPHGKTSMSPGLFDLQLADGAWAITLSTPHQIQVARHFGYQRIFLANQLIGRSAIEYVYDELNADPAFEFYCLVDSIQGVEQLARVAKCRRSPRRMSVLVEMGYRGGRTGCRTVAQGLEVARAVAAHPHALRLCGVEGFEGLIRKPTGEDTLREVESFLGTVTELARCCEVGGLLAEAPILLSAGGSAYFDLVVKAFSQANLARPSLVLLRSGCYLTHDSLMYTVAFDRMKIRSPEIAALGEGLRPVIEVWAYVQSRPEAQFAIAGLGKRDVSHDELPVPVAWFRPGSGSSQPWPMPPAHRTTRLNDQHAYLDIPADSPLAVGDMVGFGISHPCLTFDKWRVMHLVDADYVVVDSVRTYF